ncbi:hypothetical protein RFI_36197, partial [Reticulomyxa filosa]
PVFWFEKRQSGAIKLLLAIQKRCSKHILKLVMLLIPNGKSGMKTDMLSGLFGNSDIGKERKLSENDDISDNNTKKRRMNEQSSQMQVQVAVRPEVNEKKKDEEITFSNMWKFSSRIRHNFLCASSQFKPKNLSQQHQSVIAHTFSNLRTVYVHFAVNVNMQHLQQLCETFNNKHLALDGDEKSEDKHKKIKRHHRCQIYQRNYVDEIKKRKQQEVYNPELNKTVLLRNVPVQESENEIKETLEEYGYSVDVVKRFNRMPIVM